MPNDHQAKFQKVKELASGYEKIKPLIPKARQLKYLSKDHEYIISEMVEHTLTAWQGYDPTKPAQESYTQNNFIKL